MISDAFSPRASSLNTVLALAVIVAGLVATTSCHCRSEVMAQPAYGPRLMSRQDVLARRSARQNGELVEYRKCPQCYGKNVVHVERALRFDAITDCATTMRVGRFGDGGKWLCNPEELSRGTVVYSFGVGSEYSFDQDMAELFGAEVHMFDPGPTQVKQFSEFKARPFGQGTVTFHPVGLGPVSEDPAHAWELVLEGAKCQAKAMGDLARQLGHSHVDILKIDIEGGEYAALKQILTSGTLKQLGVRQLLIEFHFFTDEDYAAFVGLVDALKREGYLLFRKELNPWDAVKSAEYAFVKTR